MASYNPDQINSNVHMDQLSSHVQTNREMEMETIILKTECRIHTGGQLKSFCEDHDVVVCEDCAHYDHRKCENIVDLDRVSKGVKQHQEYKNTSASLHHLKDDLEKLKVTRQDDKTRIGEEKQKVKNKMQETAKKLQAMLATLLQKGNTQLERQFREFEEDIDSELKVLEKTLAKVDKAIHGLNEDDEKDAFIGMKTNRNIGKEAKKTIETVSAHARKETLKFTVNPAFENALSQGELGSLSFQNNNLPPRPRLFHEMCEYNATLHGTYNVNIKQEPTPCHILDSCLLNDSTMVLTDLPHNLVLHIDQAYKIKAYCEIPGEPWGVCSVNSTDIAVTLIGKQMVQFVAIDAPMELKKSFEVGMPCRGIFYKDGNLFVCCGGGSTYWRSVMEGSGQIRVYSLQGILLKTFQNDEKGKRMFGRPRDIILNPENNLFYITDETNGVMILSRSGQKVATVTDKNLIAARGITFDSRGQIFVSCLKSNQILLFEGDGVLIHIPITKSMEVSSVRSLCFKADSYRLVVTSHSDVIHVFDLARRY